MKASLQVRLSQHLALTPQLQQSIRLLQLSTLELHQEIEQMMEQNPFLEADEEASSTENEFDRQDNTERPAVAESAKSGTEAETEGRVAGEGASEAGGEGGAEAGDEPVGVDAADFGTTERDDWENGTERDDFDGIREMPSAGSGATGDDDDFERQGRAERGISLEDHL